MEDASALAPSVASAEGAAGQAPYPPGDAPPPPRDGLVGQVLRVYPALGQPEFRLLWGGMLPSNLAWQMSTLAIGYAAFSIAGNATALGWVNLAIALPLLVLPLAGGVVADRLPRRGVLLITQSTFGLASLAVALLAFAGRLAVWHLVVYALVLGAATSFNMPARQAYIAELVGPRLVRNAVALNNAGLNFCRIIGPSIAGAILAIPAIGVAATFALLAALFGLVLPSLLRLPTRTPRRTAGRGGWAEFVEGMEYIRSSPVLVALLGLALVPLFFGMPYQSLMPLFAERVFEVGATGLGVLMAAVGVGALLGSLSVAALTHHPRPALLQLAFGVGFGVGLIGFALAPHFLVALAWLLLVGFTAAAYTALNNTLIMSNTEPRLYGRIMSVYLLTFAVFPLGSMPAAWLADHFGGRIVVAGGGLIVALVVVGVAALYRPYREIK